MRLGLKYNMIILLAVLLSSCSTRNADGPPDFYVDETKIPNAVPKPEPLSKYGNLKSYVVLGRRYHTLSSSKHYEAIGLASWYGKKFHARRTSSGEPYNMLAMTAAHRALPLPTYVEVTNLSNQRKVIVKVNDRGPFATNRLIDLSYVAAKKLGMIGHGTALVKVRAINPNSYGSAEPFFARSNKKKGRFYATRKLHAHYALHVKKKKPFKDIKHIAAASSIKKRPHNAAIHPDNVAEQDPC
jgi:rare lipoprotein A